MCRETYLTTEIAEGVMVMCIGRSSTDVSVFPLKCDDVTTKFAPAHCGTTAILFQAERRLIRGIVSLGWCCRQKSARD